MIGKHRTFIMCRSNIIIIYMQISPIVFHIMAISLDVTTIITLSFQLVLEMIQVSFYQLLSSILIIPRD